MEQTAKKFGITRIIGIVLLICGLLIAIGPWTIFPVCDYGNSTMKCHYTAEAEIVVGVMIALLGLLLFFAKSVETKIVIGVGEVGLGVFAVLLVTTLTGMCPATTMECHILAEPVLKILGAVVAILGVVLIYLGLKKK
jgi:drug/metabolite transporter (DMT)-like permease